MYITVPEITINLMLKLKPHKIIQITLEEVQPMYRAKLPHQADR